MSGRKLVSPKLEAAAIRVMCSTPKAAGEMLSLVEESHFYTDWGKTLYAHIRKLYKNMEVSQGVVTLETLALDISLPTDVRDRVDAWTSSNVSDASRVDIKKVVKDLSDLRKLRQINELAAYLNRMLDDPTVEADTILAGSQTRLSKATVASANVEDWFVNFGEGYNANDVLASVFDDEEKAYVPTGIAEYDKRNGGINEGNMVVIAGTTGGGKSLVAADIAMNMALYEDVAFVPLEMTHKEMVSRMLANKGDVDVHKITSKTWTEEEQDRALEGLKDFNKAVKKQGNKFSIFRPDRDLTIEEILATLHPYDYKVICIDYIGLLKGADEEDQARRLSQIARTAKVYAATHNKIVILLAQLSEEGKVRYSRAIYEHANLAFQFVATEASKEAGVLECKLPKARNQDPTPFTLDVDYKCMKLRKQGAPGVYTGAPKKPNRDKEAVKAAPVVRKEDKPLATRYSESGQRYLDPADYDALMAKAYERLQPTLEFGAKKGKLTKAEQKDYDTLLRDMRHAVKRRQEDINKLRKDGKEFTAAVKDAIPKNPSKCYQGEFGYNIIGFPYYDPDETFLITDYDENGVPVLDYECNHAATLDYYQNRQAMGKLRAGDLEKYKELFS